MHSWKYLHEKLGTWKKAKKNADLFYAGRLTWKEWAEEDAMLWSGIEINDIAQIVQKCPLTKGAKKTVQKLKDESFRLAIISGGISFFADKVARQLKIPNVLANELQEKNGVLTGTVSVLVTSTNKPKLLMRLLEDLELSLRETVAVGDDFKMIPCSR